MMRKMILAASAALLVLGSSLSLAGPMPPPACFEPATRINKYFPGNWEIAEWNVRYSIREKGRQVCLYARDAQGDEWFEISDLDWDGKVLSATFTMPSTKWRTQSRLTLVNADKLRDEYTTKDGKHTDFWTRRQ